MSLGSAGAAPEQKRAGRTALGTLVVSVLIVAASVACIKAPDGSGTATATRQLETATTASTVVDAPPPMLLGQSPSPDAQSRHIVVIGDSYTGGSNVGGVGPTNWTSLVWNDLTRDGIDIQPEVSGAGGSGYVQPGTAGTVFGQEAARLVRPDDDVVVFFGGANDGSQPAEAVAEAARADFANVRRLAPNAVLLVIGPAWPNAYPDQLLKVRDAIRDAAVAAGATFVDPLAEGWFSATPPDFIGADNIHPTDAGHAYLAQQIEPHVREALAASGSG